MQLVLVNDFELWARPQQDPAAVSPVLEGLIAQTNWVRSAAVQRFPRSSARPQAQSCQPQLHLTLMHGQSRPHRGLQGILECLQQ